MRRACATETTPTLPSRPSAMVSRRDFSLTGNPCGFVICDKTVIKIRRNQRTRRARATWHAQRLLAIDDSPTPASRRRTPRLRAPVPRRGPSLAAPSPLPRPPGSARDVRHGGEAGGARGGVLAAPREGRCRHPRAREREHPERAARGTPRGRRRDAHARGEQIRAGARRPDSVARDAGAGVPVVALARPVTNHPAIDRRDAILSARSIANRIARRNRSRARRREAHPHPPSPLPPFYPFPLHSRTAFTRTRSRFATASSTTSSFASASPRTA